MYAGMTNLARLGYLYIIEHPGLRAEEYAYNIGVQVKTVHTWFEQLGMKLSDKPTDCVGGVSAYRTGPKVGSGNPRDDPYNEFIKTMRRYARNHDLLFKRREPDGRWAFYQGNSAKSVSYPLADWRTLYRHNNIREAML